MGRQVLIIGAGLAGMVAAWAARRAGAEALLIDRGVPGLGTNSALANGMFAVPSATYGPADYVRDVVETGKGINCISYVRQVAEGASDVVPFLRGLGLDVTESESACFVRASSPQVIPGVTIVQRLAGALRGLTGVRVLPGFRVTGLLQDGNRVHGVRGLDKKGGDRVLHGSAVVLACGGAGAVYGRSDNARTALGQGYHLAAGVGLELRDMEFVQCYPIVIAEPGLPSMMIYPPYPDECKLLNADGEDIVEKHGLGNINSAIRKRRDTFSALLMEESRQGPVVMDLGRVPGSAWREHPLSLLGRLHFDARHKPIRVAPAVHFFMGGVAVDGDGRTDLEGLYACGEIVWGLHGANRMGGNALTECFVSGVIAGRGAARCARAAAPSAEKRSGPGSAAAPRKVFGKTDFRRIRRSIGQTAWDFAGVVRSREGIREGLLRIESLEKELRESAAEGAEEKIAKADLVSAAFTVRAILEASLGREESRGTFVRSDHPLQNDAGWLKNSVLVCDEAPGRTRIRYEAIRKE